jgi:hypothetical protein
VEQHHFDANTNLIFYFDANPDLDPITNFTHVGIRIFSQRTLKAAFFSSKHLWWENDLKFKKSKH